MSKHGFSFARGDLYFCGFNFKVVVLVWYGTVVPRYHWYHVISLILVL